MFAEPAAGPVALDHSRNATWPKRVLPAVEKPATGRQECSLVFGCMSARTHTHRLTRPVQMAQPEHTEIGPRKSLVPNRRYYPKVGRNQLWWLRWICPAAFKVLATAIQTSCDINPDRKAKRTNPGISNILRLRISLTLWYSTVFALILRDKAMALVVWPSAMSWRISR